MSLPNPFPLPVINQTLDMKFSILLLYIDNRRLDSASWPRERLYCDYLSGVPYVKILLRQTMAQEDHDETSR